MCPGVAKALEGDEGDEDMGIIENWEIRTRKV